LKGSAVLGCGLGAAGFSSLSIAGAVVGAADERLNIIGPRKGFSTQIGTLVSMLTWMRNTILQPVQGLTVTQLDYLHDSKANSIGALLLHLAAVERLYQLNTFEGRKWDDWDELTVKEWGVRPVWAKPRDRRFEGMSWPITSIACVKDASTRSRNCGSGTTPG